MIVEELYLVNQYARYMVEKLIDYEKFNHGEYVFEVLHKRNGESEFTVSYEIYDYNCDDWCSDWYVGENEVIFKRFAPLDSILEYYFTNKSTTKCEVKEI